MRSVYVFLFSAFLFLGCSKHLTESVVPVKQQIGVTAKPPNTNTSHHAREFSIKSDILTDKSTILKPIEGETPRDIRLRLNLEGKKIILELPESESLKKQINVANNWQVVIHRLKAERKFSLTFENDIFDMTDRYYTNGVRFEWSGPGIEQSPLSHLMFSYGHPAMETYSMYLEQNMYTPTTTKIPPTLSGNDRPYAAYMILGHRKEISDATHRLKIINNITLGVIGSYSLGSLMQQGVHHSLPTNDPPLGWETQINNDLVAGYRLQIEKIMAGNERFQITALAAAEAGTLYDNVMTGVRLSTDRNTLYEIKQGVENEKQGKQKVKLQTYLQGESCFIGYDATLQGGMFNHDNIYTLQSDKIKKMVLKAEAGVTLRYLQYSLEIGQTIISPEYSGGKNHKWGRVTLNFYFR